VVTRYRIALEQHPYAPSTINLRLAAIRRLAYEASDCGLLSPDLAAGIRRVKGVRRLGVRVGNWLTAEEGKKSLGAEGADTLRSRRNRALLSLLSEWRHLHTRDRFRFRDRRGLRVPPTLGWCLNRGADRAQCRRELNNSVAHRRPTAK
jgi:hypothetical protein